MQTHTTNTIFASHRRWMRRNGLINPVLFLSQKAIKKFYTLVCLFHMRWLPPSFSLTHRIELSRMAVWCVPCHALLILCFCILYIHQTSDADTISIVEIFRTLCLHRSLLQTLSAWLLHQLRNPWWYIAKLPNKRVWLLWPVMKL